MNASGSGPLKVLIPNGIGLEAFDTPASIQTVGYLPGAPWPPEHLDATVVVVGYGSDEAAGTRLAELPKLRLVQTLSAGYERWSPVLPDGVMLSNARGAHGGASAEWVVAALLAVFRNFAVFHRHQSERVWRQQSSETLMGKQVVVIGAGDLAANLATRLTPFGADVVLVGRRGRPGVRALAEIDALLPSADVVVALLPESATSRHIVNAEFLALLRDGAVVVNAGRGGSIDTDALLAELNSGRLRAALDVTEPEPLPDDHPLWSAPGLLLTPHVAGNTTRAGERAWAVAVSQILAYADGGRPSNLVGGPGAPTDG